MGRARGLPVLLGPPLVAFGVAMVALYVSTREAGVAYTAAESWARRDSNLYMSIASGGYTLFHCPAPRSGDWCGNSAWFPGYPALMWPLHAIGVRLRVSALVVANAFTAGELVLLWVGFLRARLTLENVICLGFFAFIPGLIYDHAIFPLGVAGFFMLLCLFLCRRRQWVGAGLAGAGAACSYPTALVLAVALAVWILVSQRAAPWASRLRRLTATAGLTALGGALVIVVQTAQTGSWDAFFKVQAKYHHQVRNPLEDLADTIRPLFSATNWLRAAPRAQTLFLAVLIAALAIAIVARRRRITSDDHLILLLVAFLWLFPFTLTGEHHERPEALLVPLPLLLRYLPLSAQAVALAVAITLSVPTATAFFENVAV